MIVIFIIMLTCVSLSQPVTEGTGEGISPVGTLNSLSPTITSPAGGETWKVATLQYINWNNTMVGSVKLEYTTDYGSSWITIADSYPAASGSYGWTIPNTISQNCRVRISDANIPAITNTSNGAFAITVPSLTVTSPNGGEIWNIGVSYNITWTHIDYLTEKSINLTHVKIDYTTNNGTSWQQLAASVPVADHSFPWKVPNTPSQNCKIKITAVGDTSIFDVSNLPFTIFLPPVNVVILTDSLWLDANFDGTEVRVVDGSQSSVVGDSVVYYSWYLNGQLYPILPTSKPSIELKTGTNFLELQVTTLSGRTASKTKRVDVYCTKFSTNGRILSGVSQIGDWFFVTSFDQAVYRFDKTGSDIRQYATGGSIQSTLCISEKRINNQNLMFVGSSDNRLYCFDSDLNFKWERSLGATIYSSPSVSEDGSRVYIGTTNGKLICLDALTGTEKWYINVDGAIVSSPAIITLAGNSRMIYFGSCGTANKPPKLYGVLEKTNTPTIVLQREVGDSILSSPAVLEDGRNTMVIVGSKDGYVYRVRHDGFYQSNWRKYTYGPVTSSPVIDQNGTIIVASQSGKILGYPKDLNVNSTEVFTFTQPDSQAINGTPGLGPNNTLFVGSDNGTFYALDKTSDPAVLPVKWQFNGYFPIKAPTLVTDQGLVFIGDTKGDVYILMDPNIYKNGSKDRAQYKWPTFKGNNFRSLVTNLDQTLQPPVLKSPLNSSQHMVNNPALVWSKLDSATGYAVQVAKDTSFTALIYEDTSLVSTYVQLSDLLFNNDYYWRVSAKSDLGFGQFSPHFSFKTSPATSVKISLANSGASADDSVLIPVNVSGFQNVGAITIKIEFDTSSMRWGRAFNWDTQLSGALLGVQGNVITIAWDNTTPLNITSGKLLDLKFSYTTSSSPAAYSFRTASCEISDVNGTPMVVSYANGYITPGITITGKMYYNNLNKTPLASSRAYLSSNGVMSDSASTDALGIFTFNCISGGEYLLSGKTSIPWGGVNSTDALRIRRHIVGLDTLIGINLRVADVNASGTINSTDALQIRRRVATLVDTFAVGDWCFDDTLLSAGSVMIERNMAALCYGDVNASYIPSVIAKNNSKVLLTISGSHNQISGQNAVIPIYIDNTQLIGAVTLILDYNPDKISVTSLQTSLDGALYAVNKDQISLAWDDINGRRFSAGEALLQLSVSMKEREEFSADMISLSDGSEFADKEGNVLPVTLSYPAIVKSVPEEYSLLQNFPNPFNPRTLIRYELPEESYVKIEIFSSSGEKVEQLVNGYIPAGSQQVEWNAEKQPSGIYFYKMTATSKNGSTSYRMTRKMVLIK